jgi:Spy/CpxP family protein refolding chaperone
VSKDTKTIKKKEIVMKTLVIAALIALVSVSYAQTPERRGAGYGSGQGRGGGEGMMEMLDLDSATAAKVAKLRDEHQKDRIALRAKLETARVEFRAAMRKDPVDEKAALSKQKEVASVREQLQTSALEHRFAVAKLLTPEQRKIFMDHAGRGAMMDGEGRGIGRGGRNGCGGDCCDDRPMKRGRGDRRHGWDRDED